MQIEHNMLINSPLKVDVSEDVCDANLAYRYGDKVDVYNAKLCGLGVLRMMRGKHVNEWFMYGIKHFDLVLQLVAYGILTYGKMENRFKYVLTDETENVYFKLVLGESVFQHVMKEAESVKFF